jgi:transcriptional regulator with XRE-family HTH domain
MAIGPAASFLAQELRAELARRRISAAELARRSTLDPTTTRRIVRGAQAATIDQYVLICAGLNEGHVRIIVAEILQQMHRHSQDGAEAAIDDAQPEATS